MPNYKLTYFDFRGLGEPCRYLFAYAGVSYEDVRIPLGELTPEKKTELGLDWGQVPILEVDGKKFAQSKAIARYLAKKFNLVGKDEFEELKCDEIVDAIGDYTNLWSPIFRESDPTKQAEILKQVVGDDTPIHFERFEKVIQRNGGNWTVGNQLTWADIFLATRFTNMELSFDVDLGIKNFPGINHIIQTVNELPGIKEWVAKRPKTKW